jgi:hypothetical protein
MRNRSNNHFSDNVCACGQRATLNNSGIETVVSDGVERACCTACFPNPCCDENCLAPGMRFHEHGDQRIA